MAMHKAATAFACLLLSGCAGVRGFPEKSFSLAEDLASFKQYAPTIASAKYDPESNSARDGKTRLQWRNEVLEGRIADIDVHFTDFSRALYEQSVGYGIATEWLVLALAGGGAVASKGLANALSAAAAGVTGARASYDKEALYNKTLVVLLGQMIAQREAVKVKIRTGEKQDISTYPLTRGMSDVEAYYNAGTIPGALNGVATNSGEQFNQAQKDLTKLDSIPLVGLVDGETQAKKGPVLACIKSLKDDDAKKIIASEDFGKLEGALGFAPPSVDPNGDAVSAKEKLQAVLNVIPSSEGIDALKAITHC